MQTKIFWEEAFKNCFKSGVLDIEKFGKCDSWLNLTNDIVEEVDLEPLKFLKNLKELHLLCPKLTNKKYISKLESLRSICLNSSSLNQEDLRLLVECKQLKRIHICNMHVSKIDLLNGLPKLVDLDLFKISGLSALELSSLSNIKKLSLSYCDLGDLSDLSKMRKLKELSFSNMELDNLEFLKDLSLSKFESESEALNEDGLRHLSKMSGLKELLYPLSDFEFLKGSKKLESILIDGNKKVNIRALSHFPIKMVDIHFKMDDIDYAESVAVVHKIKAEVREIHPNCQFELTRKYNSKAVAQ
ncbi:hypothetical protein [Leptospira adleri]|uniref:hypothetical protein n=1 Tax=Leptospira adleri TaxID=2023186 RepID=UPI0010829A4A|nr:hypothetical protein [Leptospira adleri]TGM60158.1 hypothetical protein EHQ97_02995 [Leptospira adleri]